MFKLILASKSKVRKEILDKNNIFVQVQPSRVDEAPLKQSLIIETPRQEIFTKIKPEVKHSKVLKKILLKNQ